MKKALVILLTLAVAGGLFAQTFTWSGNFEGGLGVYMLDANDDPVFGSVGGHGNVNGARAQVALNAVNASGNAGFTGSLRGTAAGGDLGVIFNSGFGWVRFAEMVELRAGRYEDAYLGTKIPFVDGTLFNQWGMAAYLLPMDMVTVGFSLFSDDLAKDNKTWEDGGLGIWGGVGLDFGVANVQAQIKYKNTAAEALFGVGVNVLDFLPIHAQLKLNNLHEYGDTGEMIAHAFVGINLIQDLGITLGGGVGISSVEDTDMAMVFGGNVSFRLGNIVPSLDLWYVMGGEYAMYDAFGSGAAVGAGNFNSKYDTDYSYFSLRPRLDVGIGGNTLWTIGALFNVGIGDAIEGTDIGFFTGARISF